MSTRSTPSDRLPARQVHHTVSPAQAASLGVVRIKTVLRLGLSKSVDELGDAMLANDTFDLTDPHGRWLQERYRDIVPTVLPDALHCMETGDMLSGASRAAIRASAVAMRGTDVPLAVMLRGGVPAVRTLSAFVQNNEIELTPREITVLMGRAALIAHELGACWVEAWTAPGRRNNAATSTRSAQGEGLDLVAVPGTLESPGLEMLALAASGHSNERIAEATSYSPQAVKWHLARIMRSWKVGNRTALVAVAVVKGVLTVRTAE